MLSFTPINKYVILNPELRYIAILNLYSPMRLYTIYALKYNEPFVSDQGVLSTFPCKLYYGLHLQHS